MKVSTANYKNRLQTHVQRRFYIKNLFDFSEKSNKFLEKRYCLLLDSGQYAVCHTAYTEAEEFLIEPFLAKH